MNNFTLKMKPNLVLPLFLLFFFLIHFSTANAQYWLRKGAGLEQNEGLDVAVDAIGNTYTTGYFTATINFGGFSATSAGGTDVFIAKTDPNGNFLWLVSAGGTGMDRGLSIATDNAGNVYISGFFTGTANFSSTQLVSAGGSQDIFVAKYSAGGVFLWAKQAGGPGGDAANAVAIDNSGNVFITGYFEDNAQFDAINLTSTIDPVTTLYTPDIFTAKYNSAGNLLWVEQGASDGNNRGMDLVTDAGGNVYVTGQFSGDITFDNTYANNLFNSIFVVKYDPSGVEQWYKRIGAGLQNLVYGIAIDNSSNLFLTGDYLGGTIIFGPPNTTMTDIYPNRVFVIKLNSNGGYIWYTSSSSENGISARNISLDNAGNPHIIGNFQCTLSEFADQYGQGVFNSVGYKDVFVAKYDGATGNFDWARQFGGQKEDFGAGIAVAGTQPVIAGSFINNLYFPVNPSTFPAPIGDNPLPSYNQGLTICGDPNYGEFAELTGLGQADVFIAKPVDLTRLPFDFYRRDASCNLIPLDVCINDVDTASLCPAEYAEGCVPLQVVASTHTSPGPLINYQWSSGFTVPNYPIATPGLQTVSVTITSEDGCYTSMDDFEVNAFPRPDPRLTDSEGVNFFKANLTDSIFLCNPPALLTVSNVNFSSGTYLWTGDSLPPQGVVAPNITVENGVYTFTYTDTSGCVGEVTAFVSYVEPMDTIIPYIQILNDSVVTGSTGVDTIYVCEPPDFGGPELILWSVNDSVTGDNCIAWAHINTLPASGLWQWSVTPPLPPGPIIPGIYPPTSCTATPPKSIPVDSYTNGIMIMPDISYTGPYLIEGTFIRVSGWSDVTQTFCQTDTTYLSKEIFVIVAEKPQIDITFSGNPGLCPGTSATLTGITNASQFVWTFNGNFIVDPVTNEPLNPITVSDTGTYYFSTIETNSLGCKNEKVDSIKVFQKFAPVTSSNPSNGLICPGDSILLSANFPPNAPILPGVWQWFGPAGAIPGDTNVISVNTPGNYSVQFTDTSGCVMISNTVEVVQYATPFLSAAPSSVICPGGSVTIEAQTNAGSTIQWLPPLSGSDPTQVISTPGTYTVEITSCGITITDSVTITASIVEAEITPSGSTALCIGQSVTLSANSGPFTYTWLPGGETAQQITVSQANTYILEVTDVEGCVAYDTVEVTVDQLPAPTAIDASICINSTATLTSSDPTQPNGYIAWFDAPNGNLLDTGLNFTTPPLTTNTTYYIQEISPTCSSGFNPVNVIIISLAPAINASSPVCVGDDITLSTTFSSPGTIYTWTGPNGFTSNQQNPVITGATLANSGVYQLVVEVDSCVSDPADITVTVMDLPIPQIFAASPYCEGETITISTDNLPGVTINWTGPGGTTYTGQTITIPNANLSHAGDYGVTFTLGSCVSNTTIETITINPQPAVVNAVSNSPVCIGDDIVLNSDFVSAYSYSWTGPDNFSSSNNTETISNSALNNSGTYTLTTELNGCTRTESVNVAVNALPAFDLGEDRLTCLGEPITFQSNQQFSSYQWSTGQTSAQLTVTVPGTYELTVTDANGCRNSDIVTADFIDCSTSQPNIFTPNNDGFNDNFHFVLSGIEELQCKIYNRWGQLIFEFNGISGSWNGRNQNSGEPCPDGVYYYIGYAVDFAANRKDLTGFIHLVRDNN